MKSYKKLKFICFGSVTLLAMIGCASKQVAPDPSDLAVQEFQSQMLEIAKQTVDNINYSKQVLYTKDAKSDWVSHIDEADSINTSFMIGFGDGTWSGTFSNLLKIIEVKTGYKTLDLVNRESINNKVINIVGENITALKALYIAYSRVSHESIDIVLRRESKIILIRPKCVDNVSCDGVRNNK